MPLSALAGSHASYNQPFPPQHNGLFWDSSLHATITNMPYRGFMANSTEGRDLDERFRKRIQRCGPGLVGGSGRGRKEFLAWGVLAAQTCLQSSHPWSCAEASGRKQVGEGVRFQICVHYHVKLSHTHAHRCVHTHRAQPLP